ncbi:MULTISPECIES: hypothetical protein [Lysinibacillus]|uniref:EAL domain-containing protein n=1 Tax=Lysinibacillus xylanilyticus TaxID=582475 RepID=A0ABV3VYK6_9BACI
MKVYRFENDYDYKDLTFLNKEDVRLFSTFKGQKINQDWNEEIFGISEDKHTRGKLLDFDSRCYGATFIIKKKFEKLFIEEFSDIIETFPIKIKGISEEYIYINVTNVVTAINFNGLDLQESLSMMRSANIRFNFEKIENETLFRDAKVSSNYYCTQKFMDFIEKNGINGLCFDEVGTAT